MADQSLTLAVLALRRVVAATLKLGNCFTAVAIIFLKFAGSMAEICSSRPSTSKPRQAVKSSSLPIMTSTYCAMWRVFFFGPSLAPPVFPQRAPGVGALGNHQSHFGAPFHRALYPFGRFG